MIVDRCGLQWLAVRTHSRVSNVPVQPPRCTIFLVHVCVDSVQGSQRLPPLISGASDEEVTGVESWSTADTDAFGTEQSATMERMARLTTRNAAASGIVECLAPSAGAGVRERGPASRTSITSNDGACSCLTCAPRKAATVSGESSGGRLNRPSILGMSRGMSRGMSSTMVAAPVLDRAPASSRARASAGDPLRPCRHGREPARGIISCRSSTARASPSPTGPPARSMATTACWRATSATSSTRGARFRSSSSGCRKAAERRRSSPASFGLAVHRCHPSSPGGFHAGT